MQVLNSSFKQKLILLSFGILFSTSQVMAVTDLTAQENFAKARVKQLEKNMDHSKHFEPIDKSLDFHGVFYGYLPCNDCNGIKSTLSLKQKNNYLLVTQPAKESSKETYEKGKYEWNEDTHIVVLTAKGTNNKRQYQIKDAGTLILLNSDGSPLSKKSDDYTLIRSDSAKTREVHIH